jgi:branched-chain amino acid aminotransferase
MAPTPSPSSKIAWAKLGLPVTDSVNGHIQSTFSTHTQQWTAPTAVSDPWLRVHGLSPALNYGMQAFEGLKASRRPDGSISIFRPSFHAHRLAKSADAVSMPPVPEDVFIACIDAVVRLNAEFVGPHETEAILYIRPLLIADGPQLAIEPPSTFTFAVYVQPGISLHGIRPLDCLVMEEFDRAAPRGTGAVKVGGNYAPVIKWGHAARAQGCPMTLHLDSRTQSEIDEFSTSGFIGVKNSSCYDKTVLVVPDSTNVIASVTSDSCLRIARDICGWTVEKRRIPYSELPEFDEVLAVGTAASVLPIKSIARNSTGDKFVYHQDGAEPGPVGVRLAAELRKVMRGIEEDPFDWLHAVEFPDPSQAEEKKAPDVAGEAKIGLLTKMSDLNGSGGRDEVPESPMTVRLLGVWLSRRLNRCRVPVRKIGFKW